MLAQEKLQNESYKALSIFNYYVISLLEGSALMACELVGAKLITPFYGNSLYVWSSVLGTTLGGLTLGYFLGGRISSKKQASLLLVIILLLSSFLTLLMPVLSATVMKATINLSVQAGAFFSCLVFIFPVQICFGIISPVIIHLITQKNGIAGNVAGSVYAISTGGGLLATFIMGLYLIPELGLITCSSITAILLFAAVILGVLGFKVKSTDSNV